MKYLNGYKWISVRFPPYEDCFKWVLEMSLEEPNPFSISLKEKPKERSLWDLFKLASFSWGSMRGKKFLQTSKKTFYSINEIKDTSNIEKVFSLFSRKMKWNRDLESVLFLTWSFWVPKGLSAQQKTVLRSFLWFRMIHLSLIKDSTEFYLIENLMINWLTTNNNTS